MIEELRKRRVSFWATIGLVLVLLYVASFGPACWWFGKRSEQLVVVPRVYGPIGWAAAHAWTPISVFVRWYARTGLPLKVRVAVPTDVNKYGASLII